MEIVNRLKTYFKRVIVDKYLCTITVNFHDCVYSSQLQRPEQSLGFLVGGGDVTQVLQKRPFVDAGLVVVTKLLLHPQKDFLHIFPGQICRQLTGKSNSFTL